jgi:hypothetical protein
MAAQMPMDNPITLMNENNLFFKMLLQAILKWLKNMVGVLLFDYSFLKLFTGFTMAALILW